MHSICNEPAQDIVLNNEYHLTPNQYKNSEALYNQITGYEQYNKNCQAAFLRQNLCSENELTKNHAMRVTGCITKDLSAQLVNHLKHNDQGNNLSVLKSALPHVLTEQLDQTLISYFNSEYMILWYTLQIQDKGTDKVEQDLSSRWHCDGGPNEHLKLIIYLNDSEEHGYATPYYSHKQTNKLKEAGYILGDLAARKADISDLLEHLEVPGDPTKHNLTAGDAILFNPNQVAHKVQYSDTNTPRYALCLCLLPSPVHYQQAFNRFKPKEHCYNFMFFPFEKFDKSFDQNILEIFSDGRVITDDSLKNLLSHMFEDQNQVAQLVNNLLEADPNLQKINNVQAVINAFKQSYLANIQGNVAIDASLANLNSIIAFEQAMLDSSRVYQASNTQPHSTIYWPNPTHSTRPNSLLNTRPFVKKHPLFNKKTLIGTAGSEFSGDLALSLQTQGYNYFVAERADIATNGVVVNGYKPRDKHAIFNANYGNMFNALSFSQLAEKAFNKKNFNKYLICDESTGLYLDPYRDGVFFNSKHAYATDYSHHVKAVRETLTNCEVFVLTLANNECWQLNDGTVISHNPPAGLNHMVQHKVLSVQENINALDRFFGLVKEFNPNFKLILNVSAIPMMATGRSDSHHIVEANTHAKSVLRVVVDEMVSKHPDIYYFPGYELVTQCRDNPWQANQRDLTEQTSQEMVELFKTIFAF